MITAETPTVGAAASPRGKMISKAGLHAAHNHRLGPSVGSLGRFKTNCTHFKAKPLIIVMKPVYFPGLERELVGTAVGGRVNRLPDGIRLGFTVVKVHTYMFHWKSYGCTILSYRRERKRRVSLEGGRILHTQRVQLRTGCSEAAGFLLQTNSTSAVLFRSFLFVRGKISLLAVIILLMQHLGTFCVRPPLCVLALSLLRGF